MIDRACIEVWLLHFSPQGNQELRITYAARARALRRRNRTCACEYLHITNENWAARATRNVWIRRPWVNASLAPGCILEIKITISLAFMLRTVATWAAVTSDCKQGMRSLCRHLSKPRIYNPMSRALATIHKQLPVLLPTLCSFRLG